MTMLESDYAQPVAVGEGCWTEGDVVCIKGKRCRRCRDGGDIPGPNVQNWRVIDGSLSRRVQGSDDVAEGSTGMETMAGDVE